MHGLDCLNPIYEAALWWLALGAKLVPVQPRSKAIVQGFGPRQAQIATVADADGWFQKRHCNLGLVLGELASGKHLVCLDFDDQDAYQAWCIRRAGAVVTRVELASRGPHLFFIALDQWPSAASAGVELKTSGVIVGAPSIHPSGRPYQTIHNGPIAPFDYATLQDLFPAKLSPPLHHQPASPYTGFPDSSRSTIAEIKRRLPVLPIAEQLTKLRQANDGRHWRGKCPFHEDKRASFWVDTKTNVWGCGAASCLQRGTHDVINLIAARDGLSLQEAIHQLAQEVK